MPLDRCYTNAMAALAGCPNKTATVSEARDDSACQAQKAGSQALICPPSRPPLSAGFAPRGCHLCCRPRRRRMKIICAGAPKTGTTSLAAALRFLGLTVYDSPEQVRLPQASLLGTALYGDTPAPIRPRQMSAISDIAHPTVQSVNFDKVPYP